MPIITWNDSFSVSIDKIDNQHKKLISLLNSLYDAMKEGKGKDKLAGILDELIEYTEYHFKSEEEMFLKYSYSDKESHVKEHDDLRQQVVALQNKLKNGQGSITNEVLVFLKNWLNNHIMVADKKYSKELSSKVN